MNKDIFKELADVEGQMKVLKTKSTELRTQAVEEMNKEEVEKVESDFGTFYFTSRKKWTYSPVVVGKEAEVKTLKKTEEESGEAKFEETKSLAFRGK